MQIIKVFVSSVFKEMQKERDLINRQVTGIVNSKLKSLGFDAQVVFIDFRWGLDLREKSLSSLNNDVVNMCISSIDDCDLFLGLIGYDSGTRIDEISITEAEIIYAIQNKHEKDCMFYVKQAKNDSDRDFYKLAKRKYLSNYEESFYKSFDFEGAEENFVNMLAELVLSRISKSYLETINNSESQNYIIRQSLLDECFSAIYNEGAGLLVGKSGVGKSQIIKSFYTHAKKDNYDIYFDNGIDKRGVKEVVLSWLSNKKTLDKRAGLKDIVDKFVEELMLTQTKKVIIIDSLDHLNEFELYVLLEKIISLKDINVKILMATTKMKYIDMTKFTNRKIIKVDNFTKNEIGEYIDFVASKYEKQFFQEVKNVIVNHEKLPMQYPIYLSAIIHDLMIIDRDTFLELYSSDNYEERLINFMIDKINNYPDNIGDVTILRLNELNKYVSNEISCAMYGLMSVKDTSLKLDKLKSIHKMKFGEDLRDIDFITVIHILRDLVAINDDKLYFTHEILKEVALESLEKSQEQELRNNLIIHDLSSNYFSYETIFQIVKTNRVALLQKVFEADDGKYRSEIFKLLLNAIESILLEGFQNNRENLEIANFFISLKQIDKLSPYVSAILKNMNIRTRFLSYPIQIVEFYKFGFNLIHDSNVGGTYTENIVEQLAIINKIVTFASDAGVEVQVREMLSISERLCFDLLDSSNELCNSHDYLELLLNTAKVYRGLDMLEDSNRLYDYITDKVISEQITVDFINNLSDYYVNKHDLKTAKVLVEFGIQTYGGDPQKLISLSWCYNKASFIAAKEEDRSKAISYGEMSYEIAEQLYKVNPTDISIVYLYSSACNTMSLLSAIKGASSEKEKYKSKGFELKRYLHKAKPNHYVFFESYAKAAVGITQSSLYSPEQIKRIIIDLFDDVVDYAGKTDCIQAAWTFTNLYCAVVEINKEYLYKILIQKLPLFNFVLDLVVVKNKNSFENICELTNSLLRIYDQFCKQRNLPLNNGRDFLMLSYKCAQLLVSIELNYESVMLMKRVTSEIVTVDFRIVGNDVNNKNLFLERHIQYVEGLYKEANNREYVDFLMLNIKFQEVFTIVLLEAQAPNNDREVLMREILYRKMGVDVRQMILEKISEINHLLLAIGSKIMIPQDMLVMTVGFGKEIIKSEFSKEVQKEEAFKLMRNISIIHDRMYNEKMNELVRMKIVN